MTKSDATIDAIYSMLYAVCGVCLFSVDTFDIYIRFIVLVLSFFNAFLPIYQAIWRLENKESLQTGTQQPHAKTQ